MPVIIERGITDVLALHRYFPEAFPFLLESVAENARTGRYDILFYQPQTVLKLTALVSEADDFLAQFDQHFKATKGDEDPSIATSIPFRGGWFVFLAYELAQQIEPSLALTCPPYPIAYAARCAAAIVVDKFADKTYWVADLSAPQALAQMQQCWLRVAQGSRVSAVGSDAQVDTRARVSVDISEDDADDFLSGVKACQYYIINGEVFQVNLSRSWSGQLHQANIFSLYQQLRQSNPAPFAASCRFDEMHILSSSPERLISLRDKRITARPIAGTRARGENDSCDRALLHELISNAKERAEHIMLIDLIRNDLGRVCRPGSIGVDELMVIESYRHVHHIVSNVIGTLQHGMSPADALRAVFPGGTITGCPKVRCMEIIHELEHSYRGAYTGSLAYINHNGDMDSSILIRTLVCHHGRVECRAGAGVVYDSIARHELRETRNKAKGLLKALCHID